ncbi:EcsC family protein [Commensalibacter oyaizuii]|uniref:EcsC family protein n=1 Tax=Commensalibacter oyaizuii TaxID=3043873 RepID=A0ABT6Q0S3_9PROT|nr:EcsC family protein [Commensalibacter sp. TBRC 16381]MDI2090710.1 EcsC family protein [Commensalibacter sp. TBRC 16381]
MSTENHTSIMPIALKDNEVQELNAALDKLESGRSVLLRLADIMGGAVGHAVKLGGRSLGISANFQQKVQNLADNAIQCAFDVAVVGMDPKLNLFKDIQKYKKIRNTAVQAMVVTSGAVGGFAGLTGMLPDISFTTLALMREIACIAQEEGEDLNSEETRRACLEVFALRSFGNIGRAHDESELGFFSARLMLRGRPMVLLMADISYQYGLSLSQKLSLQMMPVVSALCGASLNAAFLAHYRSLARVHFIARRLERNHGPLAKETIEFIRKQRFNQYSAV